MEALGDCFDPARTEVRVLEPREVGLSAVGHFGFFRPHEGDVLWKDALDKLERWA